MLVQGQEYSESSTCKLASHPSKSRICSQLPWLSISHVLEQLSFTLLLVASPQELEFGDWAKQIHFDEQDRTFMLFGIELVHALHWSDSNVQDPPPDGPLFIVVHVLSVKNSNVNCSADTSLVKVVMTATSNHHRQEWVSLICEIISLNSKYTLYYEYVVDFTPLHNMYLLRLLTCKDTKIPPRILSLSLIVERDHRS